MTTTASPSDPLVKRLYAIEQSISEGRLPDAVKKLNAAIKVAPGDPRIYLLGSRLAEAAGNPKGAQDAARKAVSLAPEWPVAVTELAFLLARQNHFKDAIAFAEKAVALDGNNPQVLTRVIDIADRAQHLELGAAWLARAAAIAPMSLDVKQRTARNLRSRGRHALAIAAYGEVLQLAPGDPQALLGRVQSALAIGDQALAQSDSAALLALAPDDPEYRFWSELAQGATPAHQPPAMVRTLYDGFADLYDQHVVAGLKYKLPRDVARTIGEHYPGLKLNVLDLGCGTGLLGACLGRIDGALIGVDVSEKMIGQAIKHNVYDRFHQVDLLDALSETPDALYHVITALDVFIYAGDLNLAISNAHRILVPGGHLIFSCETASEEEADLVLRPSMRYAHKRSHVEAQCKAAGFAEVSIESTDLRFESDEPVAGFIVDARKHAPGY